MKTELPGGEIHSMGSSAGGKITVRRYETELRVLQGRSASMEYVETMGSRTPTLRPATRAWGSWSTSSPCLESMRSYPQLAAIPGCSEHPGPSGFETVFSMPRTESGSVLPGWWVVWMAMAGTGGP